MDHFSVAEYDNYVVGFKPFEYEGKLIDMFRVLVTVDKPTKEKAIMVIDCHKGKSVLETRNEELKKKVVNLVEQTEFYQRL